MPVQSFNNISSLIAQGNIGTASARAATSIGRLSSGNRIQQASDDVSGLAIGTNLRTQVSSLRAALNNASQGISLLSVADGALSQVGDILQRQKAIALQASSGQLTAANRALLNQEFVALTAEIDRIAGSTNFNGVKLLSGGLGSSASIASTNAIAVSAATSTAAASSGQTAAQGAAVAAITAIQAINIQTGAELSGTAAAGELMFVDATDTILADSDYLSINSSVVGQFSSFKLSDIIYGVGAAGSAKLTATINGVEFTGVITGGTTAATIVNGNTRIRIGYTAAAAVFTNTGSAALAQTQFGQDFRNTAIQRVSIVNGVDFNGTRLQGAIGTATTGAIATRLYASDSVISNFRYVGNQGAANTSVLAVDVNGQTFTATTVRDQIATAAGRITFASNDNQFLYLDLTGLTDPFTATLNIRLSLEERNKFINALNLGIARVGSGLNFAIGSAASDNIRVSLSAATSNNLFSGQALDVSTDTNAQAASTALDAAINKAVSLRASVGAFQSRFNFASSVSQTALENQEAARGSLLDTDVSSESSDFATAQVQLQAGIAVLAQANQLSQTLLRLISQ